MRLYGRLTKVDSEQRIVGGYASTECVDRAGEIVLKSAIEGALDDWLEFGNIRQMHQLSAVGKAVDASIDDKGLYVEARIVDDAAWQKVKAGVYAGYSIGGKVLARDKDDKKVITKIRLGEISLVDRPSNPEAVFDLFRAAGLHDGGDLVKALASRDAAISDLTNRIEGTLTKVSAIVAQNAVYRSEVAELKKQLATFRKPAVMMDIADPFAKVAVLEQTLADVAANAGRMLAYFDRPGAQ
jgi:HK97 family phage prohead protease